MTKPKSSMEIAAENYFGHERYMTTKEAVEHLIKELKEDPGYWISWQANIAVQFQDEWSRNSENFDNEGNRLRVHEISNKAANAFLELLCRDAKCVMNLNAQQNSAYEKGLKDARDEAKVLVEALEWYAATDLETTSEYFRSGVWRRARVTLENYRKATE